MGRGAGRGGRAGGGGRVGVGEALEADSLYMYFVVGSLHFKVQYQKGDKWCVAF